MDAFNYYYFFLHHIAAASHVISDYNSFHHQVSVCQEPQAAYYSITLLYIGCWQLNTWIHERREHSKWTSKSKKPKNYKKKRKTEKPEILENYMIECAWCKFCITNSFTSHKYRLILRPVDVTVLKSTRIKSVRGRSSKKERSLRFLLKTSTTTKHEKIKWKYSKFKMKLSKLHIKQKKYCI